MTGEYMRGHQDGMTVAKGVAESLLAQASSEKATLMRRIDEMYAEVERLKGENAKLRQLCRETWRSCPVEEDECKKCPHYLGEDGDVWCDIPIQMVDLGIEVK